MPQGYYTIEQWTRGAKWTAVAVLPFGLSLSDAETQLARRGKPGLYRLVHTQRIIWCERDKRNQSADGLRLRKSHASSPDTLKQIEQMFDRTGGRYPSEEVRAARRSRRHNK